MGLEFGLNMAMPMLVKSPSRVESGVEKPVENKLSKEQEQSIKSQVRRFSITSGPIRHVLSLYQLFYQWLGDQSLDFASDIDRRRS